MRVKLVILVLLLLVLNGCKKCEHCANICYVCKGLTLDTICSGATLSAAAVNTLVQDRKNLGNTCTQLTSPLQFDACNAKQDSLNGWSEEGYVCTDK